MSMVFMGTAEFAVPTLRAVAGHVSLVVTQPDRPSGRGMTLQPSPVKRAALELGIECDTPIKARDPEFIARIEALQPDFLLVAAYGQILSERLLNAGKHGGINLHGSILPKYRGAAPIQRAILEGEQETGISLMQMDKGMDTGDIIAIERTPIGPDETYGELAVRLGDLAATMATAWLERLATGNYSRTAQNHDQATHAAKIEKQEAELQFEGEASTEFNRYRAFTPSPGAFLKTSLGVVKISKARLAKDTGNPGEVLRVAEGCVVAFRNGSVELLEVQPEGKKRMSGRDFANGMRLKPGTHLK